MVKNSLKLKRILAMTLSVAMATSVLTVTPASTAEAASKKVVKSLSVASTAEVTVGSTKTVKATVTATKKVAKADLKLSVKSSDAKIVKVSVSKNPTKTAKKGRSSIALKGIKEGTATVTVTTKATNKNNKKLSKKIKVTVDAAQATTAATTQATTAATTQATTTQATTQAAIKLEKVNVTADTTNIEEKGGKAKLFVFSGTEGAAISKVEYASDNEQIATVKDGEVIGVNPGTANIKVTAYDQNNNKAEASIQITVAEKKQTTLTFAEEDKNVTLSIGQTKSVKPIVENAVTPDTKIEYKSNDEKVAIVTADGTIKAVGAGSAIITATVQGTTASVQSTVTVVSNSVGIASVKATHADTLNVNLTAPVAASEQANLSVKLTAGETASDVVATDWAADGKSFNVKTTGTWAAGTYNVEIAGKDLSIDDKASKVSVVVPKTRLAGLQVRTSYIPFFKEARIYYDEIDQYGDVNKNIQEKVSSGLDWTVTTDNGGTKVPVVSKGDDYVVINSEALKSAASEQKELAVTVAAGTISSATKTVVAKATSVYSVTVDPTKIPVIVQSDKEQPIELPCTAIDSNGEPVDWAAYLEGAYGNTLVSKVSDVGEDVCGAPVVKDGKLIVTVKPNKTGKTAISVQGNDAKQSIVTIEVAKESTPIAVEFVPEGNQTVSIPVGEAKEIPVKFKDQNGKELKAGVVTAELFTKNFTLATNAEADGLTAAYAGDKIKVTAGANVKPNQKYIVTATSKTTNQQYTYTLEVKDARKVAQISITNAKDIKKSLLVGEEATIKFDVLDNNQEAWKDATAYTINAVYNNSKTEATNSFIEVGSIKVDADGHGTVDVTAKNVTNVAQNVKFELHRGDYVATTDNFEFNVTGNIAALDIAADKTEYTAGQDVELTFTAYGDAKGANVLTTYNETVKDVKVYDDASNNFVSVDLTFVNGVAKTKVAADKVGDKVSFYGSLQGTGMAEAVTFKTGKTVKITAGAAVKYDITVSGTTVTVKYVDAKKNVVEAKDNVQIKLGTAFSPEGNSVTGADKNGDITVTFKKGVATLTLTKALQKDETITINGDTLTGSYKQN